MRVILTIEVEAYLEESKEVIQLFLLCAAIETHATCIQEDTDESYAEVVIRHIDRARLAREGTTLRYVWG